MQFLKSLLFNLFLYTGITTVFIIALPSLFLPSRLTLLFGKFLGYYVIFIVKFFLNTKVEIKGIENIPKEEKYFVASAHQSMFETFALQAVLNYPVFILKKELLKIPLFGMYLKKIKSIEIVRDTTTKDNLTFFDKVANIIKNTDRPLLIFPQGTRVLPAERPKFKKGTSRIYKSLKIKCQPVAINSGFVWPKSQKMSNNKTITVSILKSIDPGLNNEDFLNILEQNIYSELDKFS